MVSHQHSPPALRVRTEALHRVSKGTARLAPVPQPGGWQGVCHQCWLEEGRARARAEMGAELHAEPTQSAKRTGNTENELMARMIQVKTVSWD